MKPPRKRTELPLAAAALLLAAGVLLAAGARSALASPEPTQAQSGAARQNPFEAAQPAPDTSPQIDESQISESQIVDSSYAVGYTGIVVYPPGEAPLQPYDDETAAPPPQMHETQPPLPVIAPPQQAQPQPPAQQQKPAASYPVNLNTATQAQLETLPGIGPVKAQAILAWRAANGGFANANQLLQVNGIGQKTLDGLLPYITW